MGDVIRPTFINVRMRSSWMAGTLTEDKDDKRKRKKIKLHPYSFLKVFRMRVTLKCAYRQ